MTDIDKDLTKFKLEIAPHWRAIQTNQWKRPKWVKLPRSILDDDDWLRLSSDAKALWVTLLLIASERDNYELPDWSNLVRRLQTICNLFQMRKIRRLFHELIQRNFLKKVRPELPSYRVSELQRPLLRNAAEDGGRVENTEEKKEVGEEERQPDLIAKPSLPRERPPSDEMRERFAELGATLRRMGGRE